MDFQQDLDRLKTNNLSTLFDRNTTQVSCALIFAGSQ